MPTQAAQERYKRWKEKWVRVEFRLTKEQVALLDRVAEDVGSVLGDHQKERAGRVYDRKAAFLHLLETRGDFSQEEEWDSALLAVQDALKKMDPNAGCSRSGRTVRVHIGGLTKKADITR